MSFQIDLQVAYQMFMGKKARDKKIIPARNQYVKGWCLLMKHLDVELTSSKLHTLRNWLNLVVYYIGFRNIVNTGKMGSPQCCLMVHSEHITSLQHMPQTTKKEKMKRNSFLYPPCSALEGYFTVIILTVIPQVIHFAYLESSMTTWFDNK